MSDLKIYEGPESKNDSGTDGKFYILTQERLPERTKGDKAKRGLEHIAQEANEILGKYGIRCVMTPSIDNKRYSLGVALPDILPDMKKELENLGFCLSGPFNNYSDSYLFWATGEEPL